MRYLGSFEENLSGQLLIVLELAGAGDLAKFLFRFVCLHVIFLLFFPSSSLSKIYVHLPIAKRCYYIALYGIRFICEGILKLEQGH